MHTTEAHTTEDNIYLAGMGTVHCPEEETCEFAPDG